MECCSRVRAVTVVAADVRDECVHVYICVFIVFIIHASVSNCMCMFYIVRATRSIMEYSKNISKLDQEDMHVDPGSAISADQIG